MKITNYGEKRRAEKRIDYLDKKIEKVVEIKEKKAKFNNYSNTVFFRSIDENIAKINKVKNDVLNEIARFEKEESSKKELKMKKNKNGEHC